MTRIIHAPTLIALLVATACDPATDELERELELAADEEDAADDEEDDDDVQEPDALVGDADAAADMLRVWFEGPCSDASARSGFVSMSINRRGYVRAYVHDSMYPGEQIGMAGRVSEGGSFEAIEYAPFGECTWYGVIDLEGEAAHGAWDCGQGCAGEWSLGAP